jgi:hypothetical protein
LPSQFDEALRIPRSIGSNLLAGGNRRRLTGIRFSNTAKGRHRIDKAS